MSVLGRIHHRFDTNCLPAFLAYDCDRLFQTTACGAHEYGASIRRGAFSTAGARWHWWHRAPYEHRRTTHYMQALCMTPAAVNTRSMQRRLVSWLTHLTKAREGGARTSNPHLWLQRSTILAHKKQQPWKFDEQLQQRQSLMMVHPIPNWHWALKTPGLHIRALHNNHGERPISTDNRKWSIQRLHRCSPKIMTSDCTCKQK